MDVKSDKMEHPKREFMEAAIQVALKSKELGDYAVGSVIVREGGDSHVANRNSRHAYFPCLR